MLINHLTTSNYLTCQKYPEKLVYHYILSISSIKEESIDDEMGVDDEAKPNNGNASGSASVAGSRRSRAPRKGVASSPRALHEKEAAANVKIEKLNVIGKL